MKALLIIFMVLMTLFTYFGKYMPLEKIKPFFFKNLPDKIAKSLFNTVGALLVASSVVYIILVIVLLWNAPIEIIAAIGIFFFIKDIGRVIKDRK